MRTKPRRCVICVLLAILTLAAYWPVFQNGFVAYDDGCYITENPHVRQGISPGSIAWAFTAKSTKDTGNWHPLTMISHMLDCQIYGLNPTYHHLTNLVLHTANVLLLFVLLVVITGSTWRSAFVAALFAVHPLHVESVAWAAERKDVLSTLFWLLTMFAYVGYARRPGAAKHAPVLVLFALGLMAKPMLVTLPVVLLIVDYWPLRRSAGDKKRPGLSWKRLITEKLPMLALAFAASGVAMWAQRISDSVKTLDLIPVTVRLDNAAVSCVQYIMKMLWPRPLAVFYPHPMRSIPVWMVIGSILLLVVISAAVIALRKTRPYLFAGWLWYLVTLLPIVGIVQVGNQGMADRYTYIPLIGIFVAITWLAADLLKKVAIAGKVAIACVVLVPLACLTWQQVGYWKTSLTLFEHAAATTKNNRMAHNNIAAQLMQMGDINGALEHLYICLDISPDQPEIINNVAIVLEQLGQSQDAIDRLRAGLRINKHNALLTNCLAMRLLTAGDKRLRDPSEALVLAERANRWTHYSNPENLDTLAHAYAAKGKFDESIATEQKALKVAESLDPRPDVTGFRETLAKFRAHLTY